VLQVSVLPGQFTDGIVALLDLQFQPVSADPSDRFIMPGTGLAGYQVGDRRPLDYPNTDFRNSPLMWQYSTGFVTPLAMISRFRAT
jgi:hypothetical protein